MILKRLTSNVGFYPHKRDDSSSFDLKAGDIIFFTGASCHYSTSITNYEVLTSRGLCYTILNHDYECFKDL